MYIVDVKGGTVVTETLWSGLTMKMYQNTVRSYTFMIVIFIMTFGK